MNLKNISQVIGLIPAMSTAISCIATNVHFTSECFMFPHGMYHLGIGFCSSWYVQYSFSSFVAVISHNRSVCVYS